MSAFPRVLIISITKVWRHDPANLLLRMQFSDWPSECLAQIHSGATRGEGEFCGQYYCLSPQDRRFGSLFRKLRGPVADMGGMVSANAGKPLSRWGRGLTWVKRRVADLIVYSGIWEWVFWLRVSREMEKFARDFRPDVLFCTGYTLGFTRLPLLLSAKLRVPIVFQTYEDWPAFTYWWSPVRFAIRNSAATLIRQASVRMAFGTRMQHAFAARYAVDFHVTHHLDDPSRFVSDAVRPSSASERRIVYTGSLVLNRIECIADLLSAIESLPVEYSDVVIDVYSPGVPRDLPPAVQASTRVRFLPLPSHEDLPNVLGGGDILFLPEAFTTSERWIGMATSTKCHLYMMSGRPVLVYGPPYAGSMHYAKEDGWALTVLSRDTKLLAEAIRSLVDQPQLASQYVAQARECSHRNHDLTAGKARFRQLMALACEAN